jgi:3'(2'), 5'-bisphosphate nucleotidase|tara:strand:- start:120 stop:896 length:777 start_codon:yes stop_codon:yes gene_type:complete
LNNLDLKTITENLIDTFLEAGNVAKSLNQKGLRITIKSDKSPVTNGDLAVDKILKEKITKLTPHIPIVSEENTNINSRNDSKDFWLLDPIDGTRDYINQKEEYTLNAALIIDLKPSLGIIYAPAKNRIFYSYGKNLAFEMSKGKTTILNCKKKNNDEIVGLENSAKTPPEILKIYEEYKVNKTLRMSSSLKFCVLAAGEADIYAATARAFEWDIAAGHAILEHSGGIVTNHKHENFLYGKEDYKNPNIIAIGFPNTKL